MPVAVALAMACNPAFAQRLLPVAELVNVPASLSTAVKPTGTQMRSAIVAAALAAEWDVEPLADGSLTLTYWRDLNYSIVLKAIFDDAHYSLRYVSSDRMSEKQTRLMPPSTMGGESPETYTKRWREGRSDRAPEFRFAVDRADLSISNDYEPLLYQLSAGIRRHLRLLGS